MKNLNEVKGYQELYDKIESIVRADGDDKLNIKSFIRKMLTEIKWNSIEYTSKWNKIPIEIIKELNELEERYELSKRLKNDEGNS